LQNNSSAKDRGRTRGRARVGGFFGSFQVGRAGQVTWRYVYRHADNK